MLLRGVWLAALWLCAMAYTRNATNNLLEVDDRIVIPYQMPVHNDVTISFSVSAVSNTLLDILLLDDQNFKAYSDDLNYECLTMALCFADTAAESGEVVLEAQPKNQTIFFIISNENLFKAVSLNYSITILPAQKRSHSHMLLFISALVVSTILIIGAAFIWLRYRRRQASHSIIDESNVPLVSAEGEDDDERDI